MLDSVKSVNIAAAYTANSYKNDRDLNELKEVFNEKINSSAEKTVEVEKSMALDKVQISPEALALMQTA